MPDSNPNNTNWSRHGARGLFVKNLDLSAFRFDPRPQRLMIFHLNLGVSFCKGVKVLLETEVGAAFSYESVRPVQGSKTPKTGKKGFGVEKPPFPPTPEKGVLESKNSHFLQGTTGKMGIFFDSTRPSLGWGEMGVFQLRNPLFPFFSGFFAPVQGGRIRKPFPQPGSP